MFSKTIYAAKMSFNSSFHIYVFSIFVTQMCFNYLINIRFDVVDNLAQRVVNDKQFDYKNKLEKTHK